MQMIMLLKLVFQKKKVLKSIIFLKKEYDQRKERNSLQSAPPHRQSKVLSVCPQRSI